MTRANPYNQTAHSLILTHSVSLVASHRQQTPIRARNNSVHGVKEVSLTAGASCLLGGKVLKRRHEFFKPNIMTVVGVDCL
jgi:hypothetical protein